MKPIKPIAWRKRAAKVNIEVGSTADFSAMLNCWVAEVEELARLSPACFPRVKQALLAGLDKDDILAAEVSLPLDPACDVSQVGSVVLRRPYALGTELVLVDVSRLPAP